MRKALLALAAAILFTGPVASADQVTLKNGDRITGAIQQTQGKSILIKSEFAGDVNVLWDAVDSIQTTQPLFLILKDGQTLAGKVSTVNGKFVVETSNAGTVTAAKDSIVLVRNPVEQTAYNEHLARLMNPRLTDFWGGYVDTALSATRGNSRTLNFVLGAKAVRSTPRDVITVYANSVFANNGTGGPTVTTANAINGGIRMELNLSEKYFIYGNADFFHDEFQNLDLRNVLGGGFGFHLVKNKRSTFDVYGGGAYDQAFYSTPLTQREGELTVGENYAFSLNDRTQFTERLEFFPNLSDTGQYRGTFNTGLTSKLYRWINWQVTFADSYVSNPPPGILKNDLLLSTGLRLIFGAPPK
ncbi:MAG: DUF481 domain-containing protein [Candidatus Acidiferrales bacterium]